MNRRSWIAIVIGTGLVATISVAQNSTSSTPSTSTGGHRVAVVDLVKIFNECAQIQDLNELMKQQTEDAAKEAQQRRKVIEDKQTELSAFRPGSPDFLARRKDLVRLNIDANVWLKVTEQQMDQDKFDWTKVIYEKTRQVVEQIARERGYDVVMLRSEFKPDDIEQSVQNLRRVIQERHVIFHVPEVDITQLVTSRLDADYKAAGGKKQLGGAPPIP